MTTQEYRAMFDSINNQAMSLTEFLQGIANASFKYGETWNGKHHEELVAFVKGMKWDVAHSHMMKMERELTQAMKVNTDPVQQGVLWPKRMNVQQALRFMQGEIREQKPNHKV